MDHPVEEPLIPRTAQLERLEPSIATRSHPRPAFVAGPAVAAFAVLIAVVVTRSAGVGLRDPGHVALRRFVVTIVLILCLAALDVVAGAARRQGRRRPSWAGIRRRWRERWPRQRALVVAVAVASFYVTYWAYRNLKSVVPLVRPGHLVDGRLADIDRSMFAGHDPAALLHSLLGTGASTQVLSTVYMLFFVFIPVAVSVALVWAPDLRAGLFCVTALSINWVLGAAGYFLLPSLGPVYAAPAAFAHLPASSVADLQERLIGERTAFIAHPDIAGTAQSIGAFPSLHVSVVLTAVLAAHLLGVRRAVKLAAWILFAGTATATIYFGWHYVLDDLGGIMIAVIALTLAGVLTGFDPRTGRAA